MSNYQLIALDMDDTLLNSQKIITPKTQDAIHRAFAAGKEVVLCTGRSTQELLEYFALFPEMHYAICASGAYLYDVKTQQSHLLHTFTRPLVETVFALAQSKDVFPQLYLDGSPYILEPALDHAGDYHVAQYETLFRSVSVISPDPYALCLKGAERMVKINLYHRSQEDRLDTRRRLEHLPVMLVDSEVTGLEVSPLGADKGSGLRALCQLLGLPMEQTIAVGDSYNDLPALTAAGLGVAVGNARDATKAVCGAIVADCNHDGVAQTIDRFLLGEETH